ncbi:MAG: hypothetical protein PHH85_14270 [Candidatus Methanoperedens sp.]|nr:hypothetical protein [Candidatus Methanoperedens sp.]
MIRIGGSVEEFNEWLKPVSAIADETRFFIKPEGLEIKVVDPANVALIETNLPKTAFYKYEVDEILTAGIDLCAVNSMLENADDGEMVVMNIITSQDCHLGDPEAKLSTLELTVENFTDSISTLGPASLRKTPIIHKPHQPTEFRIGQELLQRVAKKADRVSDYLLIEMANNDNKFKLTFSAEGDQTRKFRAVFEGLNNMRCHDHTKSLYSLDYFMDLVGSIKKGRIVAVKTGQNCPLAMSFEVLNGGSTTLMIAPRVESE